MSIPKTILRGAFSAEEESDAHLAAEHFAQVFAKKKDRERNGEILQRTTEKGPNDEP